MNYKMITYRLLIGLLIGSSPSILATQKKDDLINSLVQEEKTKKMQKIDIIILLKAKKENWSKMSSDKLKNINIDTSKVPNIINNWANILSVNILKQLGSGYENTVRDKIQQFKQTLQQHLIQEEKKIKRELTTAIKEAKEYEDNFPETSKNIMKQYFQEQLKNAQKQLDGKANEFFPEESTDWTTLSSQELSSIKAALTTKYNTWLPGYLPSFSNEFYDGIHKKFTRIPDNRNTEFQKARKELQTKYEKELTKIFNSKIDLKIKALDQQIQKAEEKEGKLLPKIEEFWKDAYQKKLDGLDNELKDAIKTPTGDSTTEEVLKQIMDEAKKAGQNINKDIDQWADTVFEKAQQLFYTQNKRILKEKERLKNDYTAKLKKIVEEKLKEKETDIAVDIEHAKRRRKDGKSSSGASMIGYTGLTIIFIASIVYRILWEKSRNNKQGKESN